MGNRTINAQLVISTRMCLALAGIRTQEGDYAKDGPSGSQWRYTYSGALLAAAVDERCAKGPYGKAAHV